MPAYLKIRKLGTMLAFKLEVFGEIVNKMVWGDDTELVNSICCDSKKFKRNEDIEELTPKTLYHQMIVEDPKSYSFTFWVRIGIDPNFVFQPSPLPDDPTVSLAKLS